MKLRISERKGMASSLMDMEIIAGLDQEIRETKKTRRSISIMHCEMKHLMSHFPLTSFSIDKGSRNSYECLSVHRNTVFHDIGKLD